MKNNNRTPDKPKPKICTESMASAAPHPEETEHGGVGSKSMTITEPWYYCSLSCRFPHSCSLLAECRIQQEWSRAATTGTSDEQGSLPVIELLLHGVAKRKCASLAKCIQPPQQSCKKTCSQQLNLFWWSPRNRTTLLSPLRALQILKPCMY